MGGWNSLEVFGFGIGSRVISFLYSDRGLVKLKRIGDEKWWPYRFPDRVFGPLDAGCFFYGYIFYWEWIAWQESW